MIGLVLAAGAGRRLRPYTDTLPKALVPVDGDTTILDIALRNLAAVGLTDVTIVVGLPRRARSRRARPRLEQKYGVRLTLVHNDKAEEWNNAYSLWLARDALRPGRAAGQRRHRAPGRASRRRCSPSRGPGILLAVDDVKKLADEEMKTIFDADGRLTRITKLMDPADGVRRVHRRHAHRAVAPRPGWPTRSRPPGERDPNLYYEDGYQEYADRGGEVRAATDRRRRLGRGRQPRRPGQGPGDRMPLLARTRPDPAAHRRPAGRRRRPRPRSSPTGRISAGGDVAVVVGPGPGRADRRADPARRSARPTSSPPPAAPWTPRCELGEQAARPLVRRGGRHRRRQDDRHRQVRGHPLRPADGVGGDQPRQRRHRLPGRPA